MGFDIRRRVGRLRSHRYLVDARPGFGTLDGLTVVLLESITDNVWNRGSNLVNRYPMAFGGYLTGRLRTKWVGIRTDEVLFRDTAHGLLAWALATLLMAALVTIGSAATAGVAAAAATSTPATPPTPEAAEQARKIAVAFSFMTSLSLLIGAFVASAAGALGGFHRDEA
jgi:hypothetical protein